MSFPRFAPVLFAVLCAAAPLQAASVHHFSHGNDFTAAVPVSPGVYGLETRGGDNTGRGEWEVGLGPQTSHNGAFVQARRHDWGSGLLAFSYDYGVTEADVVTVTIGATTLSVDFDTYAGTEGSLVFGNALEIYAKRDAQLILTAINGEAFSATVGDAPSTWDSGDTSSTAVIASMDFLTGFELEGFIAVRGERRSAHGVTIKVGNVPIALISNEVPPVPLPAGLALMLGGLGAFAVVRRRQVQKKTS